MLYCSQETPAQRVTTDATTGKSRTAGPGGAAGRCRQAELWLLGREG